MKDFEPFAVISDQHFHNWHLFAQTLPDGHNSRLLTQIQELHRCAAELQKAGGKLLINCGDTYHERGSVAPSVLNPVTDAHRFLTDQGIKVITFAGNHDLENKEAERLSNAVTTLERVGVTVLQEPFFMAGTNPGMAFIPWCPDLPELKRQILELRDEYQTAVADTFLFIHAPMNGVIKGLPDNGLEPEWLASLGFRGVFSGHYHNHVAFPGEVYSVGASTHQTWGDVGSKAGFLIVSPEGVKWFKSHAPEFIELDGNTPIEELPLVVDGNFVKVKIDVSTPKEIDDFRAMLLGYGAKGVVINAERAATAPGRSGSTVQAGARLDVSVTEYVRAMKLDAEASVLNESLDILNTVQIARAA